MNTPAIQHQINALDGAYQRLSGRQFRATGVISGREEGWRNFINAGYTEQDLATTILWIKGKIKAGFRTESSLMWRVLIGDLMRFADDHNTALAENRQARPKQTPKERVVAQARPLAAPESAKPSVTAKPIAFYIQKLREAAR